MELTEARTLAVETMDNHGLIEQGWRFAWGLPRATNTFGQTWYAPRRLIEMSQTHVRLNDEAEVMQTILHEVAHALVGPGHDHGPVWKRTAASIGYKQGRTMAAVTPPAPYEGTCAPDCDMPHKKQRKSKYGWNVWTCKRCKQRIVWFDTVTGAQLTTEMRSAASIPPRQLVDLSTLTVMVNTKTGERTPVNFSKPVSPPAAPAWQGSSDWDEMFNA